MKPSINRNLSLGLVVAGVLISQLPARAVDFHVATAQDLQNALTLAAANGADDTIYLTNGYYIGNFNYNSAEARNLTLQGEPGTTNTDITIDGAGTGRSASLSSSANAAITVRGLTFLRNCGSSGNAALRIATGSGADVIVEDSRLIAPTGASGIGVEIASAKNATLGRCVIAGNSLQNAGRGASISGVVGNVSVQNCTITTNSAPNSSYGGGLYIGSGGNVSVAGSVFTGNSVPSGPYPPAAVGCGAYIAVSSGGVVMLSGNTFAANWTGYGSGAGVYCGGGGGSVTLSNNIFMDNSAQYGSGGLHCSAATLNLFGNNFARNSALNTYGYGGGARCDGTTVTLIGNTFAGNSANYGGGGFYSSSTTLTLANNTFTGNSAISCPGGGAYCSGTVTLIGNTFTGNSASASGGGGAYCSGTLTLSNNVFTSNSATACPGGGAYCSGSGTFSRNVFRQNTTTYSGGGLYADGGTVKVLNNLVVRNLQTGSSYKGGGVWIRATSSLDMINNTVFGNTAAGSGGGAAFQVDGVSEVLHVYNNIIWGNTASGNGADVHLAGTGSRKEFMFNDTHGIYGVWDIAQNLLDAAPQFFDPVNGDYHIQSTSPCKDAGTNGAPSLPDTDLDGGPRIANGTVDLGCYEFSTAATHPADTDTNFVITASEFNAYAAAWKAGQTWSNAPTVIPADYLTRSGYLMTNGGAYHNDGSARPVNWKTGP